MPGANKIALKTIAVPFVSDSGQVVMGLVLLDSGSETTLTITGFANQLGISGPKTTLTVDTVGGGVSTTAESQRVHLPFAPSVAKETVCAWTLENICAPLQRFDWQEIKHCHEHLRDVPIETLGGGEDSRCLATSQRSSTNGTNGSQTRWSNGTIRREDTWPCRDRETVLSGTCVGS